MRILEVAELRHAYITFIDCHGRRFILFVLDLDFLIIVSVSISNLVHSLGPVPYYIACYHSQRKPDELIN